MLPPPSVSRPERNTGRGRCDSNLRIVTFAALIG
jgi:hypothetical protein